MNFPQKRNQQQYTAGKNQTQDQHRQCQTDQDAGGDFCDAPGQPKGKTDGFHKKPEKNREGQ